MTSCSSLLRATWSPLVCGWLCPVLGCGLLSWTDGVASVIAQLDQNVVAPLCRLRPRWALGFAGITLVSAGLTCSWFGCLPLPSPAPPEPGLPRPLPSSGAPWHSSQCSDLRPRPAGPEGGTQVRNRPCVGLTVVPGCHGHRELFVSLVGIGSSPIYHFKPAHDVGGSRDFIPHPSNLSPTSFRGLYL